MATGYEKIKTAAKNAIGYNNWNPIAKAWFKAGTQSGLKNAKYLYDFMTTDQDAPKTTGKHELYKGLSDYGRFNTTTTTGGSSSGSGVKWYDVVKGDISGLLAAYDQQANAARATAKSKLDTTRNDLLTSINRFREQNAKDQLNQKQQYQSGQASLESARAQADRQSRIGASARGLGGSGLQQLAQLQNLLGQSEDVSKLANENQASMDKLREALKQQEEDYNTNVKNAETEYSNTLNSIASALANQKAQAIAENEQRYADQINARNAAMAQYSYSSSPGTTTTTNTGDLTRTVLDDLNRGLKSIANSTSKYKTASAKNKAATKLIKEQHGTIQALLESYGGAYNTYKSDINKMLKSYGLNQYYT